MRRHQKMTRFIVVRLRVSRLVEVGVREVVAGESPQSQSPPWLKLLLHVSKVTITLQTYVLKTNPTQTGR